jgi:hypothetical protein
VIDSDMIFIENSAPTSAPSTQEQNKIPWIFFNC